MKSYRSSLTFVTVDLLFMINCHSLKNCFLDFSFLRIKNYRLNLKHQLTIKHTQEQLHGQSNSSCSLLLNSAMKLCSFEFMGAGGGPVLLLAILTVCLLDKGSRTSCTSCFALLCFHYWLDSKAIPAYGSLSFVQIYVTFVTFSSFGICFAIQAILS